MTECPVCEGRGDVPSRPIPAQDLSRVRRHWPRDGPRGASGSFKTDGKA